MIRRSVIVLFLIVACSAPDVPEGKANQGGVWQDRDSLNMARQEVGAARIGDSVFVAGGLVSGSTPTNTVEAYDIAANSWSFVAPMPVALDHMGLAALGGKLYVIGGYSADFTPRADVWVYVAATNQWEPGTSLPQPRGAGWAVAHHGKIYHFGGVDQNHVVSRTTYIFDPIGGAWSTGAPMPTAREHLNAVSVGDYIYVVGGRNGPSTNVNERYDPSLDRWDPRAPMPTARSAMGLGAFAGKIYAMGGEIPVLSAANEVYDIASNTWSCRAPMRIPRHGVAAVTLDDRILLPGGGVVQGLAPTRAVDTFLDDTLIGVDPPEEGRPEIGALRLLDARPNPFRLATTVTYELPAPAHVTIEVHDLAGRRVITLLDRSPRPAGRNEVTWDGRTGSGPNASPGTYLLHVEAGAHREARKISLVR